LQLFEYRAFPGVGRAGEKTAAAVFKSRAGMKDDSSRVFEEQSEAEKNRMSKPGFILKIGDFGAPLFQVDGPDADFRIFFWENLKFSLFKG